jgi:D-alanyl-D-alanine carboxypeptidase
MSEMKARFRSRMPLLAIPAFAWLLAGGHPALADDAAPTLTTTQHEANGVRCLRGGKLIQTGPDTDGNGLLDANEIQNALYLCNGSTTLLGEQGVAGATANFPAPEQTAAWTASSSNSANFDGDIRVVLTENDARLVRPVMPVNKADRNKSAELYILAMDHTNGQWYVSTLGRWDRFRSNLPTAKNVVLGETVEFNLLGAPFANQSLDILYGYRVKQANSQYWTYHGRWLQLAVSEKARELQEALDIRMAETVEQEFRIAGTDMTTSSRVFGTLMGVYIPEEGQWFGGSGVANLETGQPMSEMVDRQYRIGSVTKSFTAMLILQLAQEGRLNLDDTLSAWLPEVWGIVPNPDQIRVRHLLNHTSGICSFTVTEGWLTAYLLNDPRIWDPLDLVRIVYDEPCAPQTSLGEFNYSNTNMVLLGLIAERATGHTWESEIEERFIQRLGLTGTRIPRTGEIELPEGAITDYWNLALETGGIIPFNEWTPVGSIEPSLVWSSGGIISTVRDLTRWIRAVATGELLNFKTEEEQFDWITTHVGNLNAGLGIFQNDSTGMREHKGGIGGFGGLASYDVDSGAVLVGVSNNRPSWPSGHPISIPQDVFDEVILELPVTD